MKISGLNLLRWLRSCLACMLGSLAALAWAAPVDAPELAAPGPLAVGRMQVRIPVGEVPSPDGRTVAPRHIGAWLWYPASGTPPAAPGELAHTLRSHAWRPLPASPLRVTVPSVARPDAPPAPGGRWPVVVMSHGLLNWAAAMTYLAEHLASRGYAVLGLEHEDEAAVHPLAAALLLRPLDQAGAVNLLIRLEAAPDHPLHQRLDLDRVGLIGFSMGGYGALVTAGARVNSDSQVWRQLSPDAQAQHAQPMSAAAASVRARIGAVVAIAPWGGQTAVGVLRPAGLTGVQAPTLVVAGDQDDISGYADGVRSLWAQLPATPRWLLVYENARHNIGLQGAPDNLQGTFAAWSAFEEPVWRRDRILDINRHFVTAFLDLTLRGQSERAVFLQPAVSRASEGQWPEPFGTPATGRFAGAPRGDITHWAGFQRRWAVGLRLEQHAPAPRAP